MRLLIFVLLAIAVLSGMLLAEKVKAQECEFGAFGCGHAEQHREYQGWKQRDGKGSCCNGEDCRPVRARVDDDGVWSVFIPEFRSWLQVPNYALGEPDRFGDGRSHVCTSKPLPMMPFRIFCFSPTGSKS